MVIGGYCFFILLAFSLAWIAIFAVDSDRAEVVVAILAAASLITAFVWLFAGQHYVDTKAHNTAVRQLHAQGFNVGTHDVHIYADKVDFNCVTLGLHKIHGTYRVTTKRSDDLGGGYNIVKPAATKKIQEACP